MKKLRGMQGKGTLRIAVGLLLLAALTTGTLYAAGESLLRNNVLTGGGKVSTTEVVLYNAIGAPFAGIVETSSGTLCIGGNCPSAPQAPSASPTPGGSPVPGGTPEPIGTPQSQSWLPVVKNGQ